MNIDLLEWLGYLASILVLISLLMSSIVKLRWINLLGSFLFATYGFLIGALPVGLVNSCIVFINIYYLTKVYTSKKDYFKILEIDADSKYLHYFQDFYKDEIHKYFSQSVFSLKKDHVGFYILRNLVPAGLFIASKYDEKTLKIELDFVIPEYRDFKIGQYVYEEQKEYFLQRGYQRFLSHSCNKEHTRYLEKMGFHQKEENNIKIFEKIITPIE
ncbi:inner membrane protein [Natronincola peptidivorans]|uniref:Inner membrane protein n=1 Tax=Natronincola peptidivorans TaxID=426128 RepID=A0A1I0BSH0_9FIRM|nr:GNAT family N-acetyltransferase [Natronincola peptidivorans]SET09914.1 inner membrane protein [Natronincola peptidivorans]